MSLILALCSVRFGAHFLQRGVRDVYRSHDAVWQRCKEFNRNLGHLHRNRRDLRWVLWRVADWRSVAGHRLNLQFPLSALFDQEGASSGCWISATGLGGTRWCCSGSSLTLLLFIWSSWTSPATLRSHRRQEQTCRPTSPPSTKTHWQSSNLFTFSKQSCHFSLMPCGLFVFCIIDVKCKDKAQTESSSLKRFKVLIYLFHFWISVWYQYFWLYPYFT